MTAYPPSFIHECIYKYMHMGSLYVRKHTHIYLHVFEKNNSPTYIYIYIYIHILTYTKYIEPHYVL